ncbi:hypothetical protein [Streptomyces sp. NPDC021020]|uniref:hypothetical protein n=1 Tax=Streptomyces sp. NPDC021020 TaxID=3365109 RepID=UPI00379197D9
MRTKHTQAYAYVHASAVRESASGRSLALKTSGGATPGGEQANPRFFDGFLTAPTAAATALLAVADVAATRYYRPGSAASLDPVVTGCAWGRSPAAGVYARLDVLAAGLDGDGPAGYATHWLIAERLDGDPKQAHAVADALLVLAAQGQLDPELFAAQTQAVLRRDWSTSTRAVTVLRVAAETGARATIWSILRPALPPLLRPAPINGAGALLALAAECAAHSGAKGPIPEVDEVAARKGSSQIVENARLLRDGLRS